MSSTPPPIVHWIVRMNHRNRTSCFVLLFAAIGVQLLDQPLGPWAWVALVLQFLIGPQLQYLLARRSTRPIRAEFFNMLVDGAGFGLWMAALGFPLVLTLILSIGACFNLTAFRGLRGLAEALASMAAGVLVVVALGSLAWRPQMGGLATALGVLTLHVYLSLVALSAQRRSVKLHEARQQLRASEQALQQQLEQNRRLHAQLEEQAIRDPLTGLFNRRYLVDTMERELAQAVRHGVPLSLMLMDLDHFKQVNDDCGHQTGDEVLRRVAALLRTQVRAGDAVCRYGGEEFLVLLPGMSEAQAEACAQRCCLELAERPLEAGGRALRMTWSIGVASHPAQGGSTQALVAAADRALYQAKRLGRNRVVVAGGPAPVAMISAHV
ncbi:diguanylate cyclase (GGDEF)-like protein [Sphaerotilus hippei]|uniref:diguanylate cyclase n=1 Tax=Sphaerotilus hippei TaxID=744406 RepID=A0A318H3S2_9BURK|nr:sensor domain-containing diguanylate cyclase [Sphaerotilus hippei]PXW98216.1 diguanylate cyclase (GGDEF)-like protein [Sphaerotilus hippei]